MRTSTNIRAALTGALLLATGPALAATDGPMASFNIGWNGAHVSQSEKNCGGGQAGVSLGRTLIVRAQSAHVSYEADDDTDSCDSGFWGDSGATETALTAGFVLGKSGLFVTGGPARVDFERTEFGPWGTDTGSRMEVGWSSRLASGAPVGVELLAFRTDTEVRDYHGFGVGITFGGQRSRSPARSGRGRY